MDSNVAFAILAAVIVFKGLGYSFLRGVMCPACEKIADGKRKAMWELLDAKLSDEDATTDEDEAATSNVVASH